VELATLCLHPAASTMATEGHCHEHSVIRVEEVLGRVRWLVPRHRGRREGVPHPLVAVTDARFDRVARTDPLDRWIEQVQQPVEILVETAYARRTNSGRVPIGYQSPPPAGQLTKSLEGFLELVDENALAYRKLMESMTSAPEVREMVAEIRATQSPGGYRHTSVLGTFLDGAGGVFWVSRAPELALDSLIRHRIAPAWRATAQLVNELGGSGPAQLALWVTSTSRLSQGPRTEDGRAVLVRRRTEIRDPDEAEIASVERELRRAGGAQAHEPES
jgi:hypothetical protein